MFDINTPMNCPSCKKSYGSEAFSCSACLDYLNELRLLFTPLDSISAADNQKGVNASVRFTVDKFDLHQHALWLSRVEMACAAGRLLYNNRIIKERIPDIDRVEKSEDWNRAVQEQQERNTPKPVKKALNARDKAVAGLMAIGVSRADAEASVDEQKAKMGQSIATGWVK